MPTVAVIIPAYNQGHYVGEAIRSVLEQSFQDFEIVVVDDGSTDQTREIVRGHDDPRIHYVYQENRGLSAARNTGIDHSSAPFISYLDADDLFLPDKLARLLALFEEAPHLGLAAGQAILIDPAGCPIGKLFDRGLPDESSELLLHNPLHVGSVLLRRVWQERVGLFDETLRSYEDWDMWLRLARAGCKSGWLARPVSQYRVHPGQMTRNGAQMRAASFAVLDKLFDDPELPARWRATRARAYSRAHLRAAAQAYLAGDLQAARGELAEALRLDPALLDDGARGLARRFAAWADDARVREPLSFLQSIYDSLPPSLALLQPRRGEELARLAVQLALDAYHEGRFSAARHYLMRALRHDPRRSCNRGLLAILLRASLAAPLTRPGGGIAR